jgi:hypothetical protein
VTQPAPLFPASVAGPLLTTAVMIADALRDEDHAHRYGVPVDGKNDMDWTVGWTGKRASATGSRTRALADTACARVCNYRGTVLLKLQHRPASVLPAPGGWRQSQAGGTCRPQAQPAHLPQFHGQGELPLAANGRTNFFADKTAGILLGCVQTRGNPAMNLP